MTDTTGSFATLAFEPGTPVKVTYETLVRGICSGSGNRFGAKLIVELVPSNEVPEWAAFDKWITSLASESRILEGWARHIAVTMARRIAPTSLTVRLVSTGEAIHGPLTVEVSL